ncbi:MAG: hypothetical protein CVT92_02535 [Bacteroidetes bacterium HGW-Bacteroidetes-1]|jgi:hypothetical protein|nr:MAG: hypothetical protein CVT92_02535 [Bacteroidetes bacterium HGW-Bacteroidetes-1]
MSIKAEFLEYSKGIKLSGSKYLQRIGTPGNYIYVYPGKKALTMNRRLKAVYSRFVRKSRRFLTSLSTRYDATSMNIKPKSWRRSMITLTTRSGGTLQMNIDLSKHGIHSYRAMNMGGGASAKLATSKRKGVLRYR